MQPICDILEQRISACMAEVARQSPQESPAMVKRTTEPKFGDYQANGIMALAKKTRCNPRQLAQQVAERLDLSDMCSEPQVAGPGFINLRLKPDWLAARLSEAVTDTHRLGVDAAAQAPTTVVDFSGPNIAKQMHVGHLRSTIIGDVIARVLDFWFGDPAKVIRQNHIGDWGTQFGMLIALLKRKSRERQPNERTVSPVVLTDLEAFYKEARHLYDNDKDFAEEARTAVAGLHSGGQTWRDYWSQIVRESRKHYQETYRQLGVSLNSTHECGESSYNDQLPSVISVLSVANLLEESDGAQCVFLDGFKTKDGDPLPLIVQKSDGAYLYATTDLAAIRYRVDELHADRIIYVTDARQKLHFEMVFACARKAGWASDNVTLEHVPFGSVLGSDGKPFKTRSGENIKLKALLDEAVQRARQIVDEKNPDLDDEQKAEIAQAVGIGAVKYADLSSNLTADYLFDWDKMLAMDGNTAPYMQYAYARVQSIFRKGDIDEKRLLKADSRIELTEPDELTLAKSLLRYGEVVEAVAADLRPHLLTTYLFELAQAFSGFYTNCAVLNAAGTVRSSRLLLCHQTAKTIRHGLDLLGIETIPQM